MKMVKRKSLIMETQNLLHNRSSEIPEGLYIELMNKLKIDFESSKKSKVIVINRRIHAVVPMNKIEIQQLIIRESMNWADREEILLKIPKLLYHELKEICRSRNLDYIKDNPRYQQQQRLLNNNPVVRDLLQNPENLDLITRVGGGVFEF